MPRSRLQADLARITFGVLFIVAVLAAVLWTVRPFIGPTIWAVMVVVATWPLMLHAQRLLFGRRWLAVTAMTLLLTLLFVIPLSLAMVTIVDNVDRVAEWVHLATTYHLPEVPPRWLVELPLVGELIERGWQKATLLGLRDLLPRVTPYAGDATRWLVGQVGSVGSLALQFVVTVAIAAVMYAIGEDAAHFVRRFARRLGGQRGADVVDLAGGAIRGVALGVGVTAMVQALLGGAGLLVADVPFAGLLTALMFMLCIAQVGPLPVLLPAAVWLFYVDRLGWGIFMLVVAGVAGTLDNVLRPFLIRMGADLPLLLIFAGVIGGLLSFGLVGIFVGPLVLAVGYTLLEAWIGDGETPAAAALGPPERPPVRPDDEAA